MGFSVRLLENVVAKTLALLLLGGVILSGPAARAQSSGKSSGESPTTKIFITTSTYGVMAGSLVGLASLAFYPSPGKHLRNVAIGASLGLYTGIALGAYLVYFVPDMNKARPAPVESSPSAPSRGSPREMGDPDDPLGIGKGARLVEPRFVPLAYVEGDGSWQAGFQYKF